MVRDEEDVIVPVVCHLIAEGVDHVLIADNLSKDRTRARLDELARELPVTVVDDPDPAFQQGKKMTSLARTAGAAGAGWIIPFDADELWVAQGLPVAEYLRSLDRCDVSVAHLLNHRPPLLPHRDVFAAMKWRDREIGDPKVAFRYAEDVSLRNGSHSVASERALTRDDSGTLRIHHYPNRSLRQTVRKYRQGGAALALTDLDPVVGSHWRLHAGRSSARIAVTYLRMALRRPRVLDRRLPSRLPVDTHLPGAGRSFGSR